MVTKDRLTKEQAEKLYSLFKEHPKTGRARRFAAFDDFYKCATTEEAIFAFGKLCSWMRRCRLEPMKEAAATLLKAQGERHTFALLFTRAICEGINSMIQASMSSRLSRL